MEHLDATQINHESEVISRDAAASSVVEVEDLDRDVADFESLAFTFFRQRVPHPIGDRREALVIPELICRHRCRDQRRARVRNQVGRHDSRVEVVRGMVGGEHQIDRVEWRLRQFPRPSLFIVRHHIAVQAVVEPVDDDSCISAFDQKALVAEGGDL